MQIADKGDRQLLKILKANSTKKSIFGWIFAKQKYYFKKYFLEKYVNMCFSK